MTTDLSVSYTPKINPFREDGGRNPFPEHVRRRTMEGIKGLRPVQVDWRVVVELESYRKEFVTGVIQECRLCHSNIGPIRLKPCVFLG